MDEETQGLAERLSETIHEYCDANPLPVRCVFDALQVVYAIIQREYSNVPAHKLH